VAAAFLGGGSAAGADATGRCWSSSPPSPSIHLVLVLISVGVAIGLGIPMGIVAAPLPTRRPSSSSPRSRCWQTVPALALLMFMIPLFGIGKGPALVALCSTRLLPIARNTYRG